MDVMSRPDRAVFRLPAAALFLPVLLLFVHHPAGDRGRPWWACCSRFRCAALVWVVVTRTTADAVRVTAHGLLRCEADGLDGHGRARVPRFPVGGRRRQRRPAAAAADGPAPRPAAAGRGVRRQPAARRDRPTPEPIDRCRCRRTGRGCRRTPRRADDGRANLPADPPADIRPAQPGRRTPPPVPTGRGERRRTPHCSSRTRAVRAARWVWPAAPYADPVTSRPATGLPPGDEAGRTTSARARRRPGEPDRSSADRDTPTRCTVDRARQTRSESDPSDRRGATAPIRRPAADRPRPSPSATRGNQMAHRSGPVGPPLAGDHARRTASAAAAGHPVLAVAGLLLGAAAAASC